MWQPTESSFKIFHLVGSIATLVCAACVIYICLVPEHYQSVYRVVADERIIIIIPYLLFIALGESVFSLWYFLFRK